MYHFFFLINLKYPKKGTYFKIHLCNSITYPKLLNKKQTLMGILFQLAQRSRNDVTIFILFQKLLKEFLC